MNISAVHSYIEKMDLPQQICFFSSLRDNAFRFAEGVVTQNLTTSERVRLTGLDHCVHTAWREQWKPRLATSDKRDDRFGCWSQYTPSYKMPETRGRRIDFCPYAYWPGGLEFAVWHGDVLCGMAHGGYKNEYLRNFVSVKIVEGHPKFRHPLIGKILPLIHLAASAYAMELGVTKVVYVGGFSQHAQNLAAKYGLSRTALQLTDKIASNDVIVLPVLPSLWQDQAKALRPLNPT